MTSYKSIAKSSGIIASVQIVQMVFSFIRNKIFAVVLGSSAFGLYSLYNTFIEMCSTFSLLGLHNSAVRELSRCDGNNEKIGKVFYVLNRLIAAASVIVFAVLLIFSEEIGFYLFNETGQTNGIRWVAFIMLLSVLSKEGYAILNGIRHLRDLAISQIVSSALGTIGMIIAVLVFGAASIPSALGIIYLSMSLITFYYIWKAGIKECKVKLGEFKPYSKELLNIGLGVTIAGVISTVMTIMSKSYMTEVFSISTVGYYQASATISNLYTGIILSAMGVDFMPRVSKVADDNNEVTILINQQMIFGIVLSSIAITSILLFSRELLYLLYSSEFMVADNIIRWQIVAVFLRVIAFPFSYTILAKGKAKAYAVIQVIFWASDYLLLIVFSKLLGFEGLGVNYLVAYCGYLLMGYLIVRKTCSFTFSKELIQVLSKLFVFILLSWFIASIDIDSYILKWVVNIVILGFHAFFVNHYMKNKMNLDIRQLMRNKLRKK